MEEFDWLTNRNDLEKTEDQRISRFVHGLQVSIQDQVSLQTLYTLNEAVTLSKKRDISILGQVRSFPTAVRSLPTAVQSHPILLPTKVNNHVYTMITTCG